MAMMTSFLFQREGIYKFNEKFSEDMIFTHRGKRKSGMYVHNSYFSIKESKGVIKIWIYKNFEDIVF